MHRTIVRMWLLLAVIVASMLVARPQPTQAVGLSLEDLPAACAGVAPSEPNRWLAVWNFDSSAQGCMIYTGLQPDPNQPPLIEGYTLIECTTVGNVTFKDGQAFFDGKSYLSCPFAPKPNAAPNSYGEYQDFWIYASVGLNPGYGLNPIFHHPSASMDVRTIPVSSVPGATMARLEWRLDQTGDSPAYGMSPDFIPSAKDRLKVKTYCITDDEICADPQNSAYIHSAYINGQEQPYQKSLSTVRFSTNTTTIYIGHAPGTHDYLNGHIGTLVVDPQDGRDPVAD